MTNLRDLGARSRLYDASGDDLGVCHLPPPVAIGDLAAVSRAVFRIVGLLDDLAPGSELDVIAVVEHIAPEEVAADR